MYTGGTQCSRVWCTVDLTQVPIPCHHIKKYNPLTVPGPHFDGERALLYRLFARSVVGAICLGTSHTRMGLESSLGAQRQDITWPKMSCSLPVYDAATQLLPKGSFGSLISIDRCHGAANLNFSLLTSMLRNRGWKNKIVWSLFAK